VAKEPRLVSDTESPHADAADELLIAQLSLGNREALACLFRRYARLVRAISYRILRDDSEADDLLQEIFLFVYRKCEIFDSSRGSARSWIIQMTYHRGIDRRRYLQSRHFYTRVDLDDVTGELAGPEYKLSIDEMLGPTGVPKLFEALSENQRQTLRLFFFEACTFDEIALKLGQSVGNIRNHYYRGLDKLRKQMFPGELPDRNGYGKK